MRISSAIVVASAPPFHLATTLAEVIYPTPPCRVFVDTDCVQTPGQCGGGVARIPPQIIHAGDLGLSFKIKEPAALRPGIVQ
jgi:hypothetical protein